MKTILTGIRSNSVLTLGNYLGALLPMVRLANRHSGEYQVNIFVPDLHSIISDVDGDLQENIVRTIKYYLAAGLKINENVHIYRQSYVPAHSELCWILDCVATMSETSRMIQYKEKSKGQESCNVGIFNYPILMAADILAYNADGVPVGVDQKQHLEIARDIAENFNKKTGKKVFKLPQPLIDKSIGKIIGTDGERKMSKSLGNIIGIFDDYKIIEKQIMSCYTDPTRQKATDPGHVEGNPIFLYHQLWNDDKDEVEALKARYQAGTVGDVEVKQKLLAAHQKFFAPIRERYAYLQAHPLEVQKILNDGAARARLVANMTVAKAKAALGLSADFVSPERMLGEARPVVSFDDFLKLELRVGHVLKAEAPAWSNKLIVQTIDFGPLGTRTICSALRAWYTPEDFTGKNLVYVTNIPPRKMGESVSEGMILAVEVPGAAPQRFEVDARVPAGTLVG